MAHCQFKIENAYYDEKGAYVPYECEEVEDIQESGLCIFHDEKYLADPKNRKDNELNLNVKLKEKIEKRNESLKLIGYHLPDFKMSRYNHFAKVVDFSDSVFVGHADFSGTSFTEALFSRAKFTKLANFAGAAFANADFSGAKFRDAIFFTAIFGDISFCNAEFRREANFTRAAFTEKANFIGAKFAKEVDFTGAKLTNAYFQNVQFDDQENVHFDNDLSQVSFVNTDISRIRFGQNVRWGLSNELSRHQLEKLGYKEKIKLKVRLFSKKLGYGDKIEFKILDERQIESSGISLEFGSILAVYRNLRENYEYRMRYDEAGEFFVREMEIKRKYKQISLIDKDWWEGDVERVALGQAIILQIRRNNWVVRNFSLTGLYYHLSRYGQSFSRPALFGLGIVLLSTLLWLTQPNAAGDYSVYNVTMTEINNSTNLELAFKRSLTNFLPSLSFGTELNEGLLDVAFKIVGGAVTFGLIIIALRRKFERKFRH